MPKLKLITESAAGALASTLMLLACTGVMSGDPKSDDLSPSGLGPSAAGAANGTGGTTATASSKPEVGVVTIRRLNRSEYSNTLRSLTGTTQDHGAKFPPDNLSFGFRSADQFGPIDARRAGKPRRRPSASSATSRQTASTWPISVR